MSKKDGVFLDNKTFGLWMALAVPALLALAAANHFWDWQLGLKSFFFVIPITIISMFLAERIAKSTNPTEEEHD